MTFIIVFSIDSFHLDADINTVNFLFSLFINFQFKCFYDFELRIKTTEKYFELYIEKDTSMMAKAILGFEIDRVE